MDYPLPRSNLICRLFGHRYGRPYRQSETGGYWPAGLPRSNVERRTCWLDGSTVPPFRRVSQPPPHDFLPDDQQPEGAI